MIHTCIYNQHNHVIRANILQDAVIITVEDIDRGKKILLPPMFIDDLDNLIDSLKKIRREIR